MQFFLIKKKIAPLLRTRGFTAEQNSPVPALVSHRMDFQIPLDYSACPSVFNHKDFIWSYLSQTGIIVLESVLLFCGFVCKEPVY